MFGKLTIAAAIMLYVAVLGCVVWPQNASSGRAGEVSAPPSSTASTAPDRKPAIALSGLPYRGVAMQIQRVDWIDRYKKSVDEIADLGADTVLFVIDTRQENVTSERIFLDMRKTPTRDQLEDLIGHAKKRKLRVILMPVVLLDNPTGMDWRGVIKPPSWDEWFASYRAMMADHFAYIAQSTGVDVLVIGSELVSTEPKVEAWRELIRAVRNIYKGQLTYSSNWDHYTAIHFWDALDLIGMNSYWKMGPDANVKESEIEQHWTEIQRDLLPFQKKTGKPILFLEVGWCSLANAAHEPWDYTKLEEPSDLDLQRRLYEAFFKSWYGNPSLGGFMIWEWPPGDGGPMNRGYTPKGKPAEAVLREWLAKPRWQVGPR